VHTHTPLLVPLTMHKTNEKMVRRVNTTYGDPSFSNCAAQGQGNNDLCYRAYGHHMSGSSNVVIHGSALWVFFNKMNDNKWQNANCDNSGGICETNQAFVSSASSTFWYGMSSK
jgi:glucan 1,3-beta-glucosidase